MMVTDCNWWFVVVRVHKDGVDCMCDNANNTYYIEKQDIKHYLTLDEIADASYGWPDDREFPSELVSRGIPYEVVLETILGKNDDNFS